MDLQDLQTEIAKDRMLLRLSELAKRGNVPFFLVGGYLRDLWLGTKRKDYDFTLPPEACFFISTIERIFRLHCFKAGKGKTITYRVMKEDFSMDISVFQGEDIVQDLHRRDFTVNALAFSLRDWTWHWTEGALEDIRNRRICTVSNRSIDQDPLRMLRAIRYASTLADFVIDGHLREEIRTKREQILGVPAERIRMEMDRILLGPRPSFGMEILYETGLLLVLIPELKRLENLTQGKYHHLPALSHTLTAIEKISPAIEWARSKEAAISVSENDTLCLLYAILFHDIGKQDTYSTDEEGEIHFYHHQVFSCQAARRIMQRFRFSNLMCEKVLRLIRNHMKILTLPREAKESVLRRLVHEIGEEILLLVIHTLADKEANRRVFSCEKDEMVEHHCLHLLALFRQKEVINLPVLITGRDVMAMGYQQGPKVGEILNHIRRRQVEGAIKTREEALTLLRDKFGLK